METPGSMTTPGPIWHPDGISTPSDMTAEGWTPGLKTTGGGVNTSTTFVKASEGAWQTIHARPSAGAASYPSGTRTTPARELAQKGDIALRRLGKRCHAMKRMRAGADYTAANQFGQLLYALLNQHLLVLRNVGMGGLSSG